MCVFGAHRVPSLSNMGASSSLASSALTKVTPTAEGQKQATEYKEISKAVNPPCFEEHLLMTH